MDREISDISQPISIANVASEIKSPAFVPQMPIPRILPVFESNNAFETPSDLPILKLLPDAAQGKTPFWY